MEVGPFREPIRIFTVSLLLPQPVRPPNINIITKNNVNALILLFLLHILLHILPPLPHRKLSIISTLHSASAQM